MVMQDVLVWALPTVVAIHRIGYVVYELEEKVGSIIGLKCMTVKPSFFEKHVVGRSLSEEEHDRLSKPVVVMHLQGDNGINAAKALADHLNQTFERDMMCVKVFDSDSAAKEAIQLWFPKEPAETRLQEECIKELVFLSPTGKVIGQKENLPSHYFRFLGVYSAQKMLFTKNVNFMLIKPRAFKERKIGSIFEEFDLQFLRADGLKLVKLNDYPSNSAWPSDSSCNEFDSAESDPLGIAVVFKTEEDGRKALLDSKFLADKRLFYISDEYDWKTAWQLCHIYFPLGFVFGKDMKGRAMLQASLIGLL